MQQVITAGAAQKFPPGPSGVSSRQEITAALLQLPFFSVVYRLFAGGRPNLLLRHRLAGVPLGSHWLAAAPRGPHGLVFAVLFGLLALVAAGSVRAARCWAGAARPGGPGGQGAAGRVTAVLSRVAAVTTVLFAAFVPLAAGLYLLTATAWTLAERAVLRRLAPRLDHDRRHHV